MTRITLEELNRIGQGHLPGLLGVEIVDAGAGRLSSRLVAEQRHLAPNGFLHAATVVALADTSCGYACRLALPEGSTGFTTIELKANFLSTIQRGPIACEARLVHGGRSTQLWEAAVTDEVTGKLLARFSCTQLVLWPKLDRRPA